MRKPHRVGVLGTLIWDTIHALGTNQPVEQWGGIAYSLAAWSAALPSGWEIVPLIKIGADLENSGLSYIRSLSGLAPDAILGVVPESGCRVELRYRDDTDRDEILSGEVPRWTIDELLSPVRNLDALYINHMTGLEMPLAVASELRRTFRGPIYSDLHALFLGSPGAKARQPSRLEEAHRWLSTADVVQVNEMEESLLLESLREQGREMEIGVSPVAVVTTLAGRGARFRAPQPLLSPPSWPALRSGVLPPARIDSGMLPTPGGFLEGNPTGCGDIWGSVVFASLLGGAPLKRAVSRGHRAAAARLPCERIADLPDAIRRSLD